MRKKFISFGLVGIMIVSLFTGCGNTSDVASEESSEETGVETVDYDEGDIVNIYCWNTEFKGIYEAYAADIAEKHGVEVNFIIITNDNSAYQTNLDEALAEQNEAIDDDKVDIFLIEADYATKYTKSDYCMDVSADIGLSSDDMANMYQYTRDIVTVDGKLKGVTWQATPGLFAYRRSIAKQVLGTDDPTAVQAMLSDWSKFDEVAVKMNEAGYKMLSGYDDSFRTFSNNMSAPWVSNNKINLDSSLLTWIEQTKTYTDNGYNNKNSLWSGGWAQDQGPSGNVFGFFYSTWGINFTLAGNSLADSSAEAKVGNGIYGDYAVCEGPQAYFWGGTWICAAKGSDNVPFIKDLMYRLTCDSDTMKQITLDTQDYTNNQAAMEEIASSDYKSDFLGGQNHIALFAESAKKIDMSNLSDYDSGLNECLQSTMHEYFDGNVDYETAINNFYQKAIEKYPGLQK